MLNNFNEKLQSVLQDSEAWEILGGIGGWFDGACLILACALQRSFGIGRIVVITRDIDERLPGSGDHAALSISLADHQYFVDANGLQTLDELIRSFQSDLPTQYTGHILIEPADLFAMEQAGVFAPEQQVQQLAEFLTNQLPAALTAT